MLELLFGSVTAHHLRFAVDPCAETLEVVRTVAGVQPHPVHAAFTAATTLPDVPELTATLTGPDYYPDFLSPPPTGPRTTFTGQLGRVRRTPLRQVRTELALAFAGRDLPDTLADPRAARTVLAAQLRRCWDTLVAPRWARIAAILRADIEHRARRLADGGPAAMFADLHPAVRYQPPAVLVRSAHRQRTELDARGLLLVPCVFGWPKVGVMDLAPWQPTLVYPARGAAALHEPSTPSTPAALRGVLGETKARLLTALSEPAGTGTLAARFLLAPSTVSEHLGALHAAGLLRRERVGTAVRYTRTELGDDLLAATAHPA